MKNFRSVPFLTFWSGKVEVPFSALSTNGLIGMDHLAFYNLTLPEPVTMSLLAVGGLALLRRRGR